MSLDHRSTEREWTGNAPEYHRVQSPALLRIPWKRKTDWLAVASTAAWFIVWLGMVGGLITLFHLALHQ